MSGIKNCTVLVWNSLVESYHVDAESANERAAFITMQWQKHTDNGYGFPKPRLEVMPAVQYIKNQYASNY